MAYTETSLYRGSPGTSDADLYTVPASTTAIVKEILLVNTTGTAATVNLDIEGTAIIPTMTIAANDSALIELSTLMAATEILGGEQGTTSAIDVHISGIEIT